MNFERSATQLFIEEALNCYDPANFHKYKIELENYEFNDAASNKFIECVDLDVQGQFEKCCLSLLLAIVELESGARMWPMINLYYSIYYAVKTELHLSGFSIIRCKAVYIASGKPRSNLGQFKSSERGDHPILMEMMVKKLGDQDVLQSQTISDTNVYHWIKRHREISQYKMRRPMELLNFDPFYDINSLSILEQLNIFMNDNDPYYCFDEDYAALSIPVTRFRHTLKRLKQQNFKPSKDFLRIVKSAAKNSDGAKFISSYIINL